MQPSYKGGFFCLQKVQKNRGVILHKRGFFAGSLMEGKIPCQKRTFTTEYPFVRYVISKLSRTNKTAMTITRVKRAIKSCRKYQLAADKAMTLRRIMVLPHSHSPSVIKPSQAMSAALSERQRGGTPVMRISHSQPDDFPCGIYSALRGVSRTNSVITYIQYMWQ